MQQQFQAKLAVHAPADQATNVQSLVSNLQSQHGLTFVSLKLQNNEKDSVIVSRNLYWLSPGSDFTGLQSLPQIKLNVAGIDYINKKDRYVIRIKNPSNKLAFFIHLKVVDKNGNEILPSYWSDNYISILPHKSRILTVSLCDAPQKKKPFQLVIRGQNVKLEKISFEMGRKNRKS